MFNTYKVVVPDTSDVVGVCLIPKKDVYKH